MAMVEIKDKALNEVAGKIAGGLIENDTYGLTYREVVEAVADHLDMEVVGQDTSGSYQGTHQFELEGDTASYELRLAYGSCALCDTLLSIMDSHDPKAGLKRLVLHILQDLE